MTGDKYQWKMIYSYSVFLLSNTAVHRVPRFGQAISINCWHSSKAVLILDSHHILGN